MCSRWTRRLRMARCALRRSPPIYSQVLWETAERRGGYTRLETRARAILRGFGRLAPADEEAYFPLKGSPPERCVALAYDMAMIGGDGVLVAEVCAQGWLAIHMAPGTSALFGLADDHI